MAETMLYVNEHLHDQLWDGPAEAQWIRSFAPGDYLVFTVADGAHVVVSGHPAERGTFELFLRSLDLEHLADDPRFADVADRLANLEALRDLLLEAAVTIPDAAAFEERFAAHRLASGRAAQRPRARRHRVGGGTRGDRCGARPWRRDDPHPQLAVALQ